jgi:2-methylisocitrate lyase-like PEP mutase family enzyme
MTANPSSGRRKTTQFRAMLQSRELEFLMEAHNGLSARIVEETGFRGIWASGLSISAALGVRDNNEASWTQVLEVVEFMSDATQIPILLDADTGYGTSTTCAGSCGSSSSAASRRCASRTSSSRRRTRSSTANASRSPISRNSPAKSRR